MISIILQAMRPIQLTTLKCDFSVIAFWEIGDKYGCNGEFIIEDREEMNVMKVTGSHLTGKTNKCVLGVKFLNPAVTRLPRGMENFFPNLEAIYSETGELTEIAKDDFAPFPMLKQVHLYKHKIKVLNSDLFASNPNVMHVSFAGNPLTTIGRTTFTRISELKSLFLLGANCIDKAVINDRPGVEDLMATLYAKCPPSFQMIQKEILESFELEKKIDDQFTEKVSSLLWKTFELEKKLLGFEVKLANCNCF